MLIQLYTDTVNTVVYLAQYLMWNSFRIALWPAVLLLDIADALCWLIWLVRLQRDTPALEVLQAMAEDLVELVAAFVVTTCNVRDQLFIMLGGQLGPPG